MKLTWADVEVHIVLRVQVAERNQNVDQNFGQVRDADARRHEVSVHVFEDHQDFVAFLESVDERDGPVELGLGENPMELLEYADLVAQ